MGTHQLEYTPGSTDPPVWTLKPGGVSSSLPVGYLHGMLPTVNSTDSDHDIDISTGCGRDSADAADIELVSAITKRLDASWAVGTGNGGLDAGTVANSTTYHVHIIRRSDTGVVDALFSTSATAPTMPTNYDAFRRIGSLRTDSSANIVPFLAIEGGRVMEVALTTPIQSFADSAHGGTQTTRTLNVPTGIRVMAHVRVQHQSTAESLFGTTDQTLAAPTDLLWDSATGIDSDGGDRSWRYIMTNTSGQIVTRTQTGTGLSMFTLGWRDFR